MGGIAITPAVVSLMFSAARRLFPTCLCSIPVFFFFIYLFLLSPKIGFECFKEQENSRNQGRVIWRELSTNGPFHVFSPLKKSV